jgi:ABC-2 type transport system ATP-binding protein
MTDDAAVRAVGLAKSYGDQPVLDGVDLEANGGSVFARGFDVLRSPTQERRLISLTGQDTAIDALLTGEENLLMMGRLRHLGRGEARAAPIIRSSGVVADRSCNALRDQDVLKIR